MKKSIIVLFGVLGMIMGVALGEIAKSIEWLKWLAIGGEIGFKTPITLDLSFIQFTLGFWCKVSICGVICLVAFAFIAKKVTDWLKI
ncbi:MAG: DUF4321 domain-containing protein [Clostridia bacterium]